MGIKVAIFGGGLVGRVHLEALLQFPAVESVSLAESDSKELEKLKGKYSLKRWEHDYRSLLATKEIDIVDICLPHDLHYPVTIEAFAAGKHVILEKPISNSLAEADEMIAASKSSGKRFYVALNQRFLPVHQCVKELLANGTIGKPILASMLIAGSELERMQKPENWKGTFGRAGGGVMADSGTHVVDLSRFWFGEPQAVICNLGRYVVKPVNKADDTASLILIYPNLTVNINLTYGATGQPWTEWRYIWGEEGSIQVWVEMQEPIQVWRHGSLLPMSVEHKAESWWAHSVKLGLEAAINCFHSDQPFPVTPLDARQVLRITRAAYRSAALKRQVTIEEVEHTNLDTFINEVKL
jgi:predicted dehydrogenase